MSNTPTLHTHTLTTAQVLAAYSKRRRRSVITQDIKKGN